MVFNTSGWRPGRTAAALILALLPAGCDAEESPMPTPSTGAVTFVVQVPASTPAADSVWISGDRAELGTWNGRGLLLGRRADGRFAARQAFAPGTGLQFKVTRGSWATVEKGASGGEISNRTHTVTGEDTLALAVAAWRDQGGGPPPRLTGDIRHHRSVASSHLSKSRDLIVYLPPGYDAEPARRYPVLYMHDGQNLMDASTSFIGVEWGVDETAQRLILAGEIDPLIIVGVYNTADRIAEYTPRANSQGQGGNADNYGLFLAGELKPFIDATYHTRPEAEWTGVAGSSLGGNVSLYLGLTRPQVFTRIGVVSPAAWFADRDLVKWVEETPKRPIRIREDIGTAEGSNPAGTVADARALRDALLARGWVLGQDLEYLEVPGAAHNEAAWAARFDRVLKFLYPRSG